MMQGNGSAPRVRRAGVLSWVCALTSVGAALLAGCGGSSSKATFTLEAVPGTVTMVAGGETQSLAVNAIAVNGFNKQVSVSLGTLPDGVTATPSSLTLTPGTAGQFVLTASSKAAVGSSTVSLSATGGSMTVTGSATIKVDAVLGTYSASLSATSFDFGGDLVGTTLSESVVKVTNTGTNVLTLAPVLSGDTSFSIASADSCGATLAAAASCDMVIHYAPATASAPAKQTAMLTMGMTQISSATPQSVTITGSAASVPPATVTATGNPQVALYTMTLPFPGSMRVDFGESTSYGRSTWTRSTATAGGEISIYVAGMKPTTEYHMAATVTLDNGITFTDADHTFTTGKPLLTVGAKATTTAGMTPSPGVELMNALGGMLVSDLDGTILWTYSAPDMKIGDMIDGAKFLPNGDMLLAIGQNSSVPLTGMPAGSIVEIREVNLAGDTVREIDLNDLNAALAQAGCAECNVTLADFHHEITALPNGHMIVVANTMMALSSTTKPSLTNAPAQTVLGDVLVDLDENLHPVWVWNTFNHLDPNRHPLLFPDWTHANAVIYSPDDGNLVLSLRHQHWVVKIDYKDGAGTGNILWKLGNGGTLTLLGDASPQNWQYAQHLPAFFSKNTSGVFSLGLMDNGNTRVFSSDVKCSATGPVPCNYSTAPIFEIDESAKTAKITFRKIFDASEFSSWGGDVAWLDNGDVEVDLCGLSAGSHVVELTREATPKTVWSMITNSGLYRSYRMPSLYPGVQW